MNINRISIKRRSLLGAVAAGMAVGALPGCSASEAKSEVRPVGIIGKNGKRVLPWSNWSGNQSSQPSFRAVPRSESQLIELIKNSEQSIRMVGAGHSFSPLVPTNETIISLARLRGIEKIHHDSKEVDILAGTKLSALGKPLWDAGLALINMPDIDTQVFAGAIATSTHGTGAQFGSMSSTVTQFRLINAAGDVVECSKDQNREIFHAAGNNLGVLGAVTAMRVQVRDAYSLKERSWMMPLEEGLERAEELRDTNQHFELFALPHGDYILGITLNETSEPAPAVQREDNGSAYEAFRTLSKAIDFLPFLRGFLVNMGARSVEEEIHIDRSYEIFSNLRDIRFNEMEYSVPAEKGVQCLKEVLDTIRKENIDVVFPIEVRYVKADDIWLSPFYQRDSCSISCHNFHDLDYKKYFAAIEPIFWKYDGRPHWGKIHTLGSRELAARYPKWQSFLEVRQELDPKGLFLNDYLKKIFVPV